MEIISIIFTVIVVFLLIVFIHNRYKLNQHNEDMEKYNLTGKWFYMKTSSDYILKVQKNKNDGKTSYFKAKPEEINILKKYKYIE